MTADFINSSLFASFYLLHRLHQLVGERFLVNLGNMSEDLLRLAVPSFSCEPPDGLGHETAMENVTYLYSRLR